MNSRGCVINGSIAEATEKIKKIDWGGGSERSERIMQVLIQVCCKKWILCKPLMQDCYYRWNKSVNNIVWKIILVIKATYGGRRLPAMRA